MTTRRSSHRRSSGSIRRLSSGSWQARYTGPDGALRSVGTFPTKAEADQALAHETSRMAHGIWHDPRRGQERLGDWFREWVTTRGDLAESTRALYLRLLSTWIDAPLSVERPTGRPMAVHLGAQTLASITPADVREWDSTVLAASTHRAVERWERARSHPRQVNAAIRRWAVQNGIAVAQTGRIPAALRGAWLAATGDTPAEDRPRERNAKTVKKLSLDAIGREQLERARDASSGRSSSTVFGGHEQVLRQTVIALRGGSSLTEHNSPGEATIIVLSGHVRLSAGSTSWEGRKGDLLVIPPERHSLEALKDAVIVLTAAKAR